MKRFILYLAIFVTVLFWGIPETPAGDISDHAQDNHLNDDSTPPALAPVPPGRGSGEGSKIFVVWYEYDTSSTEYKIWFDMSTDKGTTWNTDERVDSGTASDRRYHASIASKTPIAGGVNLYTAWLDERNTSDREVFFSRSTNQGDDWSTDLAIASPGDVGNNAILPPGIAIDHGNDDVMVVFKAGSELYYVHGDSPYSSTDWDDPVQLITANHNDVDEPCICGTDGDDFGVTWKEYIGSNYRIRFAMIAWNAQQSAYSVSTPVTVSGDISDNFGYAMPAYIPVGGGYGAAWYASFWNSSDNDIYIGIEHETGAEDADAARFFFAEAVVYDSPIN